jgi:hypothetical protein
MRKKPSWFHDTLQDAKGTYISMVRGFSHIEGVDFKI